jgi:hypothetical protein
LSAPMERVFETRSAEVDANDETVRSDVVAFDAMRFVVVPVETSRNASDDDPFAINPAVVRSVVEVAFQAVAGVNGKAKVAAPSAESDEAPITPVGVTVTMLFVALPILETVRFVVEARDAVRLVVEAYGATSAEPENVRKAFEVSWPPVVANGMRVARSEESVRSVVVAVVNDA